MGSVAGEAIPELVPTTFSAPTLASLKRSGNLPPSLPTLTIEEEKTARVLKAVRICSTMLEGRWDELSLRLCASSQVREGEIAISRSVQK